MRPLHDENPPKGDLRQMMAQRPLPEVTIDSGSMAGDEPTKQASAVLNNFKTALTSRDAQSLERCFYSRQSYWKDRLAMTWHLRTFNNTKEYDGHGVIAAALLKTAELREVTENIEMETAQFVPATETLVSEMNPAPHPQESRLARRSS